MASYKITAQDIAEWWTPDEALRELTEGFVKIETSKDALLGRLKSGMVVAAAHKSFWKRDGRSDAETTAVILIEADHWNSYGRSKEWQTFWTMGDIEFNLGRLHGSYGDTSVRYFAVRFDPRTVRDMLSSAPQRAKEPSTETAVTAPKPDQPKKPVSPADLQAWYDLYSRIYGGTADDTEANAVASAQGMFPTKSVSRDRVRELRGEQKRGPKGPRNSGG